MKAIISSGGKGTRVHELTGSVIPKGLSRISPEIPKPVISYQIERLISAGITEMFITFEFEWQVQLFRQSLRVGEIPTATYVTDIISWGSPLHSFKSENIVEFIGDDDFLWTYGDLFYSRDLIPGLVRLMEKNDTSVASVMHSTSGRWVENGKRITFLKDHQSRVIGEKLTSGASFTLHAPILFQNRALECVKEEVIQDPPHTISLLRRLLRRSQISAYEPDFLVNMNTPLDLNRVKARILEERSRVWEHCRSEVSASGSALLE